MATVTQARIRNLLTVSETLDNAPAATTQPESRNFDEDTKRLSPTTTPPVSKAAQWEPQLPNMVGSSSSSSSSGVGLPAAATLDIDLTNLPGIQGDFSGSGLRVQFLRLRNPATNQGEVVIGPALATPYDLFGNSQEVTVPAGGKLTLELYDSAPVVSGSEKLMQLSGRENDTFELEILLG